MSNSRAISLREQVTMRKDETTRPTCLVGYF